ncbi:hypothetical protein L6164_018623 [Bauhinia variegata]|uniref:Uncharacterized protein n=1 Tax=Bauhinia variegata TaxID=167791 RepID=A0ACB9NBL7_BAUVA|nr:hypothetical protein L6164_018623 [Bauhinia variegata]
MSLIFVYGYLMFLAAKSLSAGREILLQILGPGVIGHLGCLSKETAQTQVSVAMGLLAGSTVMLLTVLWGSCLIVGKCDLENSVAVEQKDTKGFSIHGLVLYQIFLPWIQSRLFACVKHKYIMSGLLEQLTTQSKGRFLKDNDEPDIEVIQQLFETLAKNSSGHITAKDLKSSYDRGMHFEGTDMEINDAVVEVIVGVCQRNHKVG